MYEDYNSPSTSTSSGTTTSLCRRRQHLHSNTHSQRATKASDIAHLLDPSYSPTRSAFASTNRIYVDHAGEVHDPDFRLFAPANYSPKRREFLTSLPDPDYDEDEDAAEEESIAIFSTARRDSFDSYRPTSRASDPSPSALYSYNTTGFENTYTYTYPHDDDEGYVSEEEPRRESNKLRRRRDTNPSDSLDRTHSHPAPASPTTVHSFRRQWHAIRLRTQVAAFRAKRRMSRIIRPLSSNTG
ncbi:hypothetical protein BU17DRAFT_97137 [Hysterangium stoloniferum]|nr:hypothetical protein BU17DRAFT_97137 [Hysterangium stoloniferum]